MRIIIETGEGEEKPSVQPEGAAEPEPRAVAPPTDLAARAAAMGAASAGPAPAEAGVDGPSSFVQEPGTPETAPDDARGESGSVSAGAAPDFAAGPLEVQQVEGEAEDAGQES